MPIFLFDKKLLTLTSKSIVSDVIPGYATNTIDIQSSNFSNVYTGISSLFAQKTSVKAGLSIYFYDCQFSNMLNSLFYIPGTIFNITFDSCDFNTYVTLIFQTGYEAIHFTIKNSYLSSDKWVRYTNGGWVKYNSVDVLE